MTPRSHRSLAGLLLTLALLPLASCTSTKEPNKVSPTVTEAAETSAASVKSADASAQPSAPTAVRAPNAPGRTLAPAPDKAPQLDGTIGRDGSRIYQGTGQFVKPAEPKPPAPRGPEEFTLNFESTDIRAVIQAIMGDYLRESFTIHPQTTGTVTIRLSRPVPRSELMQYMELLLRQNGQVMLKEDNLYKIMPSNLGTRGSVTPQVVTTPAALPGGYSVQIVQLKYAGVRDMAKILEPYAIEPQSSIRTDELRNLLILSGTQRELKHMLEVIGLFDVDYLSGYSVGLFPMQTDVKSLAADLDRIFGGTAAAPAAPGQPAGAGGGAANPLAGIVRIIPVERLNGLLVITTQPRYLEEAKKWIDRLDKGGGLIGGTRLNVYPVQHGRADRLAALLSDVYGSGRAGGTTGTGTVAPGQRPATIATPQQQGAQGGNQQGGAFGAFISNLFQSSGTAVSKDTRIIPDNDNNSLLIFASPADYETILGALRQLDVPRRQVLVEVMVAEVKLTDELAFGVEWFMKDRRNDLIGALRNGTGTSSFLPNVPAIASGVTDLRNVIPQSTGLQLINSVTGDIRGVINMLGKDGRAKIQFAPKLLVLDNEKGIVNVGSRISVNTGTTTGTGGQTVTTNQYIDTGVLLTVTPRINAGGRVTMEINQEVSSANRAVTGNNNPDIDNRKAQTTVNVGSGQTMVLAGLIRNETSFGTQGVPLLSKIPFLGGLFGSQTKTDNRTELVVLITPTVVTNTEEAEKMTDELRQKFRSLEDLIPRKGAVAQESVVVK